MTLKQKKYVFTIAQPSLFLAADPKVTFSIIWVFLGNSHFNHIVSSSFPYKTFHKI